LLQQLLPLLNLGQYSLQLLVMQLMIGGAAGLAIGWLSMKVFARIPVAIGSFAPVASLAACAITYGLTDILGGSGFLAVYLVGLAIGSTPSRYRGQLTIFHEGAAFLAQVGLFIILGLFAIPHNLGQVVAQSVILMVGLVFFIRPAAVWASTSFLQFSTKERMLLSWAGLKGAVPIVFAGIVFAAGVDKGRTIYDVVFFVVILSTLLQGTTLSWLATKLGLTEPPDVPLHAQPLSKPAQYSMIIQPSHAIAGVMLHEIGLPPWARVARVTRGSRKRQLDAKLILEVGDTLFVTYPPALQPEFEDVVSRWRRRI
jgi:cell volume regulation protein A